MKRYHSLFFSLFIICSYAYIHSEDTQIQDVVTEEIPAGLTLENQPSEEPTALDTLATNKPTIPLVALDGQIPGLKIELRYACTKNITGQRIYPRGSLCYVRPEVMQALANVQYELESMGYGLVMWDAYQSKEAQMRIWELIENDAIVCDPSKIVDAHAQGLAVDVTLYSLESKRKLAMPTDFDSISTRACRTCKNLPKQILKNRDLLAAVMTKHGFEQPNLEWWHFEYCLPAMNQTMPESENSMMIEIMA